MSVADWIIYANQGATRSQPVSRDLVDALSFLPEMGLQMEVFSGGQPSAGNGPRVGSTRHDHGGAADVFFRRGNERLDWANPEHVPVFQDIVRQARANGVTGFGAGDGYMQPGSMHLGFGNPAVWGADGKGANAPDWLREAFGSTPGAPAPSAPASPESPPARPELTFGSSVPSAQPGEALPLSSMFGVQDGSDFETIGPVDFMAPQRMARKPRADEVLKQAEQAQRRVALADLIRY